MQQEVLKRVTIVGECWIWNGRKHRQGYGLRHYKGKGGYMAHRWAYEMLVGPIPSPLILHHTCGNEPCVNPDHLQLVTRSQHTSIHFPRGKMCWSGHHEMLPENVTIDREGGRHCKLCQIEYRKNHPRRKESCT